MRSKWSTAVVNMAYPEKKRRYEKQYCFHYDQEVLKSTWYLHCSQYFNPISGEWEKETSVLRQQPYFNFAEELPELTLLTTLLVSNAGYFSDQCLLTYSTY